MATSPHQLMSCSSNGVLKIEVKSKGLEKLYQAIQRSNHHTFVCTVISIACRALVGVIVSVERDENATCIPPTFKEVY